MSHDTLERELKCIVDDEMLRIRMVEAAGAVLTYAGEMVDYRLDTPDRVLEGRDHVLRVRSYRAEGATRASIDWKGPTEYLDGLKVREELSVTTGDPETLLVLLENLGYEVTQVIERMIRQYDLDGTMIRFERYPRLYSLCEVEGTPAGIDRAIGALGIARDAFMTWRLKDFVAHYERETGTAAAINAGQLG
jgi:adenylate cyclase class IV